MHQDNFNLRCQLEEWKKGTINHCTIEKTSSPQVEKGESSRKRPNEQGQGKTATKKARIIRHCHCEKLNHRKSECWRKTRKYLKYGSSNRKIKECPILRNNPRPELQVDN